MTLEELLDYRSTCRSIQVGERHTRRKDLLASSLIWNIFNDIHVLKVGLDFLGDSMHQLNDSLADLVNDILNHIAADTDNRSGLTLHLSVDQLFANLVQSETRIVIVDLEVVMPDKWIVIM